MVNNTMDALEWLRKQLDGDENDLLREMVREFAQRLMAAEVDALAGAGWGEVSPERVNYRNGYRPPPVRHQGRDASSWPSRSSVGAATSRTGCWTRAGGPSGRWWRWWPSATSAGVSTRRVDGLVEDPGHRGAVEVPGVADGRRARRDGGGVPQPAPGRRALHLCVDGRLDPEGPRGRPDHQRRGGHRRRGQRATGHREILGLGRDHHRGRRRLAGVPARPGRPRPVGHARWSSPTPTPGWSTPSPRR